MRGSTVKRLAASLVLGLLALSAPGCAGCENSVCCSVPGHVIPNILRPSQCTSMGGTAVAISACEVVCCEASDGTVMPGPRASCRNVVDARLCGVPDGGR